MRRGRASAIENEWSNQHHFYSADTRTRSYFSNSELAGLFAAGVEFGPLLAASERATFCSVSRFTTWPSTVTGPSR